MHIFQLIVLIRILNPESPGEPVSKIMAGSGLQRFAIVHQCFNGIGGFSPCKFLFICFLSLNHWNRKHLFTEIRIEVQHLDCAFLCLFCRSVGRMAFLPEEFRCV